MVRTGVAPDLAERHAVAQSTSTTRPPSEGGAAPASKGPGRRRAPWRRPEAGSFVIGPGERSGGIPTLSLDGGAASGILAG